MDKHIDARFDRVEKALSTLIDSIAKYNPSIAHANELAAADRELSKGLEDCERRPPPPPFVLPLGQQFMLHRDGDLLTSISRLPTVQAHQNNYLRIQALRAQTAALDAQIKDTLTVLAATRRDMTSTAATAFPETPGFDLYYGDLLSYARRISKFTMPPAGVTNGVDVSAPPLLPAERTSSPAIGIDTPGSGQQTPGGAVGTPAAAGGGASASGANGVQTPGAMPTQTQTQTQTSVHTSTSASATLHPTQTSMDLEPGSQATLAATTTTTAAAAPSTALMPEHLAAYLNPLTGAMFVPWPGDDKIRMGALAANQELAAAGVDVRGFDPAAETSKREEAEQERERLAREESERRMREERERLREREEREGFRRASIATGGASGGAGGSTTAPGAPPRPAPPAEKKQFQFMGDIDDDDDEDD